MDTAHAAIRGLNASQHGGYILEVRSADNDVEVSVQDLIDSILNFKAGRTGEGWIVAVVRF